MEVLLFLSISADVCWLQFYTYTHYNTLQQEQHACEPHKLVWVHAVSCRLLQFITYCEHTNHGQLT